MKKFHTLIYILLLAALVLPLSGCGGSSDNSSGSSATDKLMVVASPVLQKGESYRLYRGNRVSVLTLDSLDYNPTYYVAPIASSDTVTMNLQFDNVLSQDQPFAIEHQDENGNRNIVFYYNPNGNGQTDLTTEYGDVFLNNGSTQRLRYNSLTLSASSLSAASIDLSDSDEEVVIVLNEDTATVDGAAVPALNYVWHADPDHRDEYYTQGIDGSTEYTEDEMLANVSPVKGVYINHDIRYMPNTLNFTGTAKNDEETEYAAYYSDSVAAELAAELGDGFEGPYIFATLPQSAGTPGGQGMPGDMGGQNGQFSDPRMRPTDPAAIVYGAVSNSDIAAFSTMTHSAEDAFNNPVLHITEPGTYRLRGTWNGQIWIEAGETEDDKVALILDGVTVTCTVAPALVFKEVYECGPSDEDTVAANWRTLGSQLIEDAGALVVIADGSTNNFTGANVYRMLKAQKKKDSVTTIDGSDVSQQKKRCKMDGAFYSFMSMVIGADNNASTGVLNITSTTYEGLNTEMHLTVDSGIINITAEDDGINVNEDNVSVFTMDGGTLTIVAKNGDGIDSNGYAVFNNGTLDITAVQDSDKVPAEADGPIDVIEGGDVYMSDSVTYTHRAYSGSSNTQPDSGNTSTDTGNTSTDTGNTDSGNTSTDTGSTTTTTTKTPISITDPDDSTKVLMSITYSGAKIDTETTDRGIAVSGDVFTLTHTVNDFAGVK